MTTVEVLLPDDLASQARDAGLLASDNFEALLREQLRKRSIEDFFKALDRIRATDDTPAMSEDDIAAEIKAMRAEQRAAAGR